MRVRNNLSALLITALLLTCVHPAFGVSKEIIQLQTQVQTLSDQVSRMQQSIDERLGVMRNLVEQSADSVNKMSVAVTDLQRKTQTQSTETDSKLEQVSGQIQSLHDTVDELKARLAKITKQLDDMQQSGQNLAAGQPTASVGSGPLAPAPEISRPRPPRLPQMRSITMRFATTTPESTISPRRSSVTT